MNNNRDGKKRKEAYKAYKNVEFLTSSKARSIRILSEYVEPYHRFIDQKVENTIIFFGSARLKPREATQEEVASIEHQLKTHPNGNKALEDALRQAKDHLAMSEYYEDAVELSKRLTEWSMKTSDDPKFQDLYVTSGGGPGIMEAANKGAMLAGGKSIGLGISLPYEQSNNDYISDNLRFKFHYFFMRKFWFIYLAKAIVVFPGGYGTLDELFETLTLVQTEKIQKKIHIVLYGSKFWNGVVNFPDLAKWGVIDYKDLELFHMCDSVEDAFSFLTKNLGKYTKENHK